MCPKTNGFIFANSVFNGIFLVYNYHKNGNQLCIILCFLCVGVCVCYGLDYALKICMLKSLPPVPWDVTVFGARTFKEVFQLT